MTLPIADMQDARVALESLRVFFTDLRDDEDGGELECITEREIVVALKLVNALAVLMSER